MVIDLIEGQPLILSRDQLTDSVASKILLRSRCIDLEFPSPANGYHYQLLASTTVGQIPIDADVLIRIQPKVRIQSIFQMLEVAYRLRSFKWHEGLVNVGELGDFFERLASILAHRILDRGRQGLYREYCRKFDDLSHVRGRIDVRETSLLLIRGVPAVRCEFEEHTADIDDNQILLYTLSLISRMPIEHADVKKSVRSAARLLFGSTTLRHVNDSECLHRLYNRLNIDYHPLHALCRFFLRNAGPSISSGDHTMVPFTVEMPGLFELFVAEWLKARAPNNVQVRSQYKALLDADGMLSFKVDMVLFDRDSGRCIAVLDTKYKSGAWPSESDIQQIIAYAVKMGTDQGYLVYPSAVTRRIDMKVGGIRIKSLIFELNGDVEEAGTVFMTTLFAGRDQLDRGNLSASR